MKKGMRLLAVLSATVLLISGCGTQMYELTEDEETLITQYAAYAIGKHNIRQKDGMTSDKPQEEDTTKKEQKPQEDSKGQQDTQAASESGGEQGSGENLSNYPEVSLADALGCDTSLKITYKGYKVFDAYKEGNYFSVNAGEGNTLLVMNFVITNSGKKTVKYDTSSLKNTFYGMFDGSNRIGEKMTFSNKELSSSTVKLKAGKKTSAVMLFEIAKDTASSITNETLLVEIDGTTYRVKM